MNIQAEAGEVVEVFPGHQPDDFADCPPGVEAGQAREGGGLDFPILYRLGNVVECDAFRFREQRTVVIPVKGIEFLDVSLQFGREYSIPQVVRNNGTGHFQAS